MKKSVVTALVLVLGFTLAASASDSPGTITNQVVVDGSTRSKVLNDYTLLTRDAIQRAWKTPLDLNVPGAVKGRIRVDYTVKRSGELDSVNLVGGSGNSDMDQSLIGAIRSAQPFPPFPDDLAARKVLIRANFIVADLPTAPVTRVSQPAASEEAKAPKGSPESRKRYKWGLPAGTSNTKPPTATGFERTPAQTEKYRWGSSK